ncbi:DUF6049 family protein [Georgenia muralis]|uniref:Uncharacterized protein n=1 Tax=Georgenia muralis TaxID=154117 RepID=A0A3N4Z4V3_9MICO|nr:DUF6049 family protein [Georgenia muralis]RPF26756.1 hypothetical protein EDD32_1207 [Georgenia muralis]
MNPRRVWAGAALAAGAALLTPAVLPAAAVPAAARTASSSEAHTVARPAAVEGDGTADLEVEITDVAPAVLRPDQPLRVTGTIVNDTAEDVTAPVVRLRVQRTTPVSRSALERWLQPGTLSSTVVVAREELPAELPAGATATFSVEIEPATLPLLASHASWGPRGIEASVHDASGTTSLEGADRSYLLWEPDLDLTAMPVGLLVPVVPTAEELREARAEGTDVATAATPRLLEVLAAVDQPGVTLAVDGLLLAEPGPGPQDDGATDDTGDDAGTTASGEEDAVPDGPLVPGPTEGDDGATVGPDDAGSPGATDDATDDATDEPTDEPTGDPTDAPAPREEGGGLVEALALRSTAEGSEVTVLPWSDADVAALAHAGRPDLLTRALDRAQAAAEDAGLTAGTDLSWPVSVDQVTAARATANGAGALVVPDSAVPTSTELTFTPSGRTDLVVAADATLPALVVDERLSAVLGGTLPGATTDDEALDLTALDARQLLLAETAVIARERPNDPRAVVMTLPRAVGTGTDLDLVAVALDALADAPWTEPATAGDLTALAAATTSRQALPEESVAGSEVDPGLLAAADAVAADAVTFAAITPEPDVITTPVVDALTPVVSTAWREDPAGRESLVAGVAAEVAALDGLVVALPSSTLNLINSSAQIPVNVRNDLGVDVTVRVLLEPGDLRLQAPQPVPLVVPAGSQATAQVQVRAVGSGDVRAGITLLGPDGAEVGTAADLQVRVRADWENVGTAVVAGLLGVMLVVGIVRTVRRGPRTPPVVDEDS